MAFARSIRCYHSSSPRRCRDCGDFEIAVMYALKLGVECVYYVLDSIWIDKKYSKSSRNENAYILTLIGENNIE